MQESARWSDGCRNHYLFAMGFKNVWGIDSVGKESARWWFFLCGEKGRKFE